jgi:hydrogenase maturation factor
MAERTEAGAFSVYSVGKLPPEVLKNEVLRYSGALRPEVLIGPGLGEDAALIRWGEAPYLVAASDPVVGATQGAGRLLVHVNANDVACKGGDPSWLIVTLIVPVQEGRERVRGIMEEIHAACASLGIAVVGGHTEMTDRYDRPILVGTMLGPSRRELRADNIQRGDVILATKHVGLEGMSILAHDRPDLLSFLSAPELAEVRSWQNRLSVVKEARLLRDWAHYMHDPTEGGLAGGVAEVRCACGLRAVLNCDVPISPLTARAAEKLGFDPLHLISSGVLIAVLAPGDVDKALKRLGDEGIEASVVGCFTEGDPAAEGQADVHEELWEILDRPVMWV